MSEPQRNDSAYIMLTHRNGESCIQIEDGSWLLPLDAGGEGGRCENPEHATEIPHGFAHWQYGDLRPAMPHVNLPERIEWGASVGMTHRYEYTADNASHRRRRISYPTASGPATPNHR